MKRMVRRGITHELTPEQARKQHGEHWQLRTLNRRDGQHLCYCCKAQATGRSSMNIWGTVCDFETCNKCHAENDGLRADCIPTSNISGEPRFARREGDK